MRFQELQRLSWEFDSPLQEHRMADTSQFLRAAPRDDGHGRRLRLSQGLGLLLPTVSSVLQFYLPIKG